MTGQEIYIYILHSNLINFLIMVSILVWIFKKCKLGDVIDSMAEDIKKNVTTSAEAVQNVLAEYKKTKKESRFTQDKKDEIIENAKQIIKNLKEANIRNINDKKAELDKNSEKLKDVYKTRKIQKTALKIQNAIYELSLDSIQKIMNDDLRKKLVENALCEFENIEGVLK